MTSIFMKLYVMSHTSEIWIFEVIFVDFRLTKNIFFNKTESFVGRNTSNHACQIFCSKSNCETMYHWFFLFEITVVKKMNNLNVCPAHSYLYPRSRLKTKTFCPGQSCMIKKSIIWPWGQRQRSQWPHSYVQHYTTSYHIYNVHTNYEGIVSKCKIALLRTSTFLN